MQPGMGINQFGMTKAFFNGGTVSFTYSKGYYCDPSVSSRGKLWLRGRGRIQGSACEELRPAVHHRATRFHGSFNVDGVPERSGLRGSPGND